MRTIYQINSFANTCGYFYNAEMEEDFNCNNGYNCKHPQQEETETNEETGKEVGKCYAWSCPLGYEAGEEDFTNPEIDQNGYSEYEENEFIVVEMQREGE